ncbi:MAG: hypothetical protein EB150_06755 [Nitrososphaeria archaeon]|nr:hypothetical protein [Nitrososphaeria archaeon]
MVSAGQIQLGDEVIGLQIPGIPDNFLLLDDGSYGTFQDFVFTPEQIENATETVVTVVAKQLHETVGAVAVNGDIYTIKHLILGKRDGEIRSLFTHTLQNTDLIYNYQTKEFVPIESLEINLDITIQSYSINVEPSDFYFTENGLTFDMHPLESSLSGSNDPDGSGPL